jgi:hypothetical protein
MVYIPIHHFVNEIYQRVTCVFVASMSNHFNVPIWGALTAYGVALACLTVLVPFEIYYVNNYKLHGDDSAHQADSSDEESASRHDQPKETSDSAGQDKEVAPTARSSQAGQEHEQSEGKGKHNHNPSKNKHREKLAFLRMSKPPKWYHLAAGVIGITYLTCGLVFTKYIGSTLFFLPTVVAQVIASAVIDIHGTHDL